ncbi:MAG: hypothetical protein VB878_16710 [Pirellulaceae bacterium]
MSMAPMGPLGSIAGSPLAQTKGGEADRARQESARQTNAERAQEKSENAAGLGAAEEEHEAADRDADGRRLWETNEQPTDGENAGSGGGASDDGPKRKDASGQRGNRLDLSG